LLFVAKLCATSICLGSGASGGIFSPSLFMGATLGAAFGAFVTLLGPVPGVTTLSCAIIGMAAMVGGATGAAMTAVTMIFEMTRDYHVIMPVIVAVALSIGVRRLLSDENIYTIKLARRGQAVPKALHANMFLVRHADQVMIRDVLLLPAETGFDEFLRDSANSGMKHIVVTRGERIAGVLRVNTALRRGLEEAYTGVTLGDIADHNYTIARTDDVIFDVVDRMWHRGASMAIVRRDHGRPRASSVVGVIDKELIADSVAESIRPYSRWATRAVAATATTLRKARH
jgi:CIC family chloride channel protein